MSRFIAIATAIFFGCVGAATASTLNFDDLADDATTGDLLFNGVGTYNGFSFGGYFLVLDSSTYDSYPLGVVSPHNAIASGFEFDGTGIPSPIANTVAFTLNSLQLTAAHLDGQQYQVNGRLSGSTVFSTTVTLTTDGPTLFTFDWIGIDEVTLAPIVGTATGDPYDCGTINCYQYVLDDLTYNEPVSTSIAEPASLATLAVALAVLVRRARRKA